MDDEVYDEQVTRPDGRVVAWTRTGPDDGVPVLRMPGTPGSRWMVRADRTAWQQRNLRTIVTERPGFGRSTRLPGRGYTGPVDDVAAILDHLGIDKTYVTGTSGGGPHLLAFCARHPDRVIAASVISGGAPLTDDEIDQMIDLNAKAFRLARERNVDGLRELLTPPFEQIRADPLGGLAATMEHAPASDRAIMTDPGWRQTFGRGLSEAFAPGIDGWIDEALVLDNDWDEIDLGAIRTSITWWHGREDKNVPWTAAKRLADSLPSAAMRELGAGHFAPYLLEGDILDDLLERGTN